MTVAAAFLATGFLFGFIAFAGGSYQLIIQDRDWPKWATITGIVGLLFILAAIWVGVFV